jgi:hypothetical protein
MDETYLCSGARPVFWRTKLRVRRGRCECQKPGTINSGVRGIVAGPPDELGRRLIERCDACEQYCSDEAAGLEYAVRKGGACKYDGKFRVLWTPV